MKPKSILRIAVVVGALATTANAHAFDWGLRLEAGAAFPVNDPQKQLFEPGANLALKLDIGLVRWLSFQVGGTFYGLPADAISNLDHDIGVAWLVGGGLRLHRPFDAEDGILFPWLEVDVNYARTGGSNNFAYDVGAGLYMAGDDERRFLIGPYLRYAQIIDPSASDGRDTTDPKILSFGISAEFGAAHAVPKPPVAPPSDRDGDGVIDTEDRCPDVPGPRENGGCPVELDSDHDGVLDKDDACPTVPGKPELKGCPDKDNDGITDAQDACPDEAGPAATMGCPDRDGDGVPDKDDKCPDVVGPKENNGCPPDKDGDGVPDKDDNCPDVPGTAENHGCPEYKAVKVTADKLVIADKIFFAFDKATILSRSFMLLNEVAKVLNDNKKFRVRVEGHTDTTGKAAHNKKLSQQRAESVRTYLVKSGVAPDRLLAEGFGSEKPIADNKTEVGRETNRRVEFVIIPLPPQTVMVPLPADKPAPGTTDAAPLPTPNADKPAPSEAPKTMPVQ